MSGEIDRIVRMLEKTFKKQPWYGPSVNEVLSQIDQSIIDKHSGAAHSILELVLHMTAWRTFTIKRLEGDDEYDVPDELNFPRQGSWEDAIQSLKTSQTALVAAIKKFPKHRLGELVPSKVHKYTYYSLLHGIIQHDVYHLGQIAVLKKAFEKS